MTIDERIMFLVHSTESLHQRVVKMTARIKEHTKQIEKRGKVLTNIVEAHEERLNDLDEGNTRESQ